MLSVLDTPAAMRDWSDAARTDGRQVVLVPTMGALHRGHLALVDEAHRRGDRVVVSIFVNPLQFDVHADFDAYPRPTDDDIAACARAGVHAVYAPMAAAMYPAGFDTHVEPGALAARLEGEHRPGHFRGVATVVTKLLAAVRPHAAVFGRKDAQQLAVVRRLSLDLDLGVEIVGVPIVREPDGLALSSRNARLTPAARAAAVCLSSGLGAAAARWAAGERRPGELVAVAREPIERQPLARLEHLEAVDPDTFEPAGSDAARVLLVVAAWFGDVRLIDNVQLEP